MKIRQVVAGAVAFAAITTSILAAVPASAADPTPPWETGNTLFPGALNYPNLDPNSKGGLTFYDASGTEITGGSDLTHIADFIVTTGTPARTAADTANVIFALPDHTKPSSLTWAAGAAAGSQYFPVLTPSNLASVASTVPVASLGVNEGNLSNFLQVASPDTTAGYANIIQVRVKDGGYTGATSGVNSPNYFWSVDIEYNDGVSALTDGLLPGHWKVYYPAPPSKTDPAVSAVTASPVSPAPHASSVDLSVTVSVVGDATTHPAGTVHFFDGLIDLGAASYDTVTGLATFTDATPADGSHSYTAHFTPTDSATYNTMNSASLSFTVSAAPVPKDDTATTISSTSPSLTAITTQAVTVTAHVADIAGGHTATVPTGSITVKVDGSAVGTASVNAATGNVVVTIAASTLTVGTHALTAEYTPSGNFNSSTTASSTTYTITLAPPVNFIAPSPGTARVGVAALCNPGAWTYAGTFKYQWFKRQTSTVAWTALTTLTTSRSSGVLASTYAGWQLRCLVTASNPTSQASAYSAAATVALGAASTATARPSFIGTPAVGSLLTARVGTWTTPTPTSYLYVWKVGTVIVSRASTYRPTAAYRGLLISLSVSALRTGYLTATATSAVAKIA